MFYYDYDNPFQCKGRGWANGMNCIKRKRLNQLVRLSTLKKKKYFRFNSWIGHTNPKRPSKDDKSAQNPGPITAAGWRHCGSCRQDGQRGKHASQQAETSSGDVSTYWLAQRGAGIAHRVAQSWTRQEWREQNRKINLSLKGKVWREKHVFFSIEVLL